MVLLVLLLASFKSTKSNKTTVSIVIPAFNEESNVANVIKVANKISYITEIIVVNDGSTDKTEKIAKTAGAKVINHEHNQGKGSAIKTGFKKSKGEILAFIDADISNLTEQKIDAIIKPILKGKVDLTKTKFARESGRVTELTAKPLLGFFFPEVKFEQPLSGQFAGTRSALSKIKFEKDYGVDVGIVLDADVHGIKIEEVDIGDISHDMSPLSDLNQMANEVVRTIINRAVDYGRVTMMDTLGNYIRLAIMGLSLAILGIFMTFYVASIPWIIDFAIAILGVILTIYYLIKIVSKSIHILRKGSKGNMAKSFVKMHFPVIVSGLVLVLMLSTFLSAANFSDGKISIEPTSQNLILFDDSSNQSITVRGPYTVDSALEGESNMLRVPANALSTLEIAVNDTIGIGNDSYSVNTTREGEPNLLRLPVEVRHDLELSTGDIIANSRLNEQFENSVVDHNVRSSNLSNFNATEIVRYTLGSKYLNATSFSIELDNQTIGSSRGIFNNESNYSISIDGSLIGTFNYSNIKNGSYETSINDHELKIKFENNNMTSVRHFIPSEQDSFIHLTTNDTSLKSQQK